MDNEDTVCLPSHLFIRTIKPTNTRSLDEQIIEEQWAQPERINRWIQGHGITEQDDHSWWRGNALVVVENDDLRRGVTSLFHDSTTAGHPGIAKTCALLQEHYWWPGIKWFVTDYVRGCAICQMNKVNTRPTKPPIFPITPETDALPFETIALDLITDLPNSAGYDSILTITDHDCTKSAFFIPTHKTADTWEIANLYVQNIFPHDGIPKKIISDRDPRFTSKAAKEICYILQINQNISTAFHPQTDGQSERTNQSLEQYLRLFCNDKQSNWHAWLPIAQYTRNSWPNATTKKTPFDLLIGYMPQAHQPSRPPTLPSIETRLKNINDARRAAQEAQSKAQASWVKETPRYHEYETGTQVWLEGTNLKLPEGMTKKLSPRRYGPFRVVAKISPVAYMLELPPQWKIHPTFHASLLTPYKETSQHGPNFVEPPPDIVNGEEEWEIEQITNTRLHGRWKKRQYLVRWKGYSPAHDQWINDEDMSAPELIEEYQQQHPEKFHPHQTTNTQNSIRTTKIDQDSQTISHPSNPLRTYATTNPVLYHLLFEQNKTTPLTWPASVTSGTLNSLKITQSSSTRNLNPSPSLQTAISQTTTSSPCPDLATSPYSHWMDQSTESSCGSKEATSTSRPPSPSQTLQHQIEELTISRTESPTQCNDDPVKARASSIASKLDKNTGCNPAPPKEKVDDITCPHENMLKKIQTLIDTMPRKKTQCPSTPETPTRKTIRHYVPQSNSVGGTTPLKGGVMSRSPPRQPSFSTLAAGIGASLSSNNNASITTPPNKPTQDTHSAPQAWDTVNDTITHTIPIVEQWQTFLTAPDNPVDRDPPSPLEGTVPKRSRAYTLQFAPHPPGTYAIPGDEHPDSPMLPHQSTEPGETGPEPGTIHQATEDPHGPPH